MKSNSDLLTKYNQQKYNAFHRNIDWLFTYETWLKWWIDSGKLELRGRKSEEYCMCRIKDKGPYSPTNVYCATNADNNRDTFKNGIQPFGGKTCGFLGKNHSVDSKIKIKENNAMTLSDDMINERIKIYKSIDMSKRGSLNVFSNSIGVSHSQARRFINKYINCLKN